MKKMLFLVLGFSIASLQAAVDFELINKAPERIWVRVTNGTVIKNGDFDYFSSDPGTAVQLPLNRNKTTKLEIWKGSLPTKLTYEKYQKGVETATRNVAGRPADLTYSFPAGRMIYVTLDKTGIRPQTGGHWLGALWLSLKNNITMNEIKKG